MSSNVTSLGFMLKLIVLLAIYSTSCFSLRILLHKRSLHMSPLCLDPSNERLSAKCDALIDDILQALRGNIQPLRASTTKDCKWSNPIISNQADLFSAMLQFSRFFSEPVLHTTHKDFIDARTVRLTYQLSFWYPLPWRPRIVIPSTAFVQFAEDEGTKVNSVVEKWELSLFSIFVEQMLPRWWDAWHVFSSFAPECSPNRKIGTLAGLEIVELPAGIVAETTWSGLAKYPGPPILAVPGFSLPGKLKSARPRREPYVATLPVEVQSYRYSCPHSGEAMKRTVWRYRIPTSLQHNVLDKVALGESVHILPDSLLEPVEDDAGTETATADTATASVQDTNQEPTTGEEVELRVGFQNLNVMKSITAGALRNTNFTLDRQKATEFEAKERITLLYKNIPKQTFAVMSLKGEVTGNNVARALDDMKTKLRNSKAKVGGKVVSIADPESSAEASPMEQMFTLQLWDVKACFNAQAEPAMAVYEMQYGFPSTRLLLKVQLT